MTWEEATFSASGTPPPARSGHTFDVVGTKAYLFGGTGRKSGTRTDDAQLCRAGRQPEVGAGGGSGRRRRRVAWAHWRYLNVLAATRIQFGGLGRVRPGRGWARHGRGDGGGQRGRAADGGVARGIMSTVSRRGVVAPVWDRVVPSWVFPARDPLQFSVACASHPALPNKVTQTITTQSVHGCTISLPATH